MSSTGGLVSKQLKRVIKKKKKLVSNVVAFSSFKTCAVTTRLVYIEVQGEDVDLAQAFQWLQEKTLFAAGGDPPSIYFFYFFIFFSISFTHTHISRLKSPPQLFFLFFFLHVNYCISISYYHRETHLYTFS